MEKYIFSSFFYLSACFGRKLIPKKDRPTNGNQTKAQVL
jgi:hypothetical protein